MRGNLRRGSGRRTSMRRLPLVLAAVSLALGACSDGTTLEAGAGDDSPADGRVQGTTTVLESSEHGPQLCFGGVADSYPPQCGGPDIVGWDWAAVDGEESANGTTWGDYTVIGTYADGTFTLTETPKVPEPTDDQPEPETSSTPCPEPEGGWQVVDVVSTTQATQDAAIAAARAEADFSGVWVDQSINPVWDDGEITPDEESTMNDPSHLVLNVRFTGDLERHEAELRQVWGGALCVSEGSLTEAEVERIQAEVSERPGTTFSGTDTIGEQVELGVIVDDGLQAQLDAEYGEGVIDVQPGLVPVP